MSSIDERVVQMKFNNAQFEQGVKTTLGSLDHLNKGLKLEGAAKGLTDVAHAAKNFSLAHITQAVDTIAAKFTSMSIIATTALTNIINRAVDTGTQLIKSLTIGPISAGFAEYELKMGSIQTILANTARYGTTLEQVNKALEDLNHYADQTIYNFGDMTKNIGLFTNAGIRVEDATSMIKGFSNAAAASGTSAEGAAGAAYQLSQALSAGKITLMDWRSLTNVGMGNKNMQDGIIAIASAMGTFKKAGSSAKDAQQNFNGTLEKGWLTADVMSSYLRIMAGDMDAAKMKSMGLSAAQIATFQAQQKTAQEAAQKVRTFTQLIGTLREAVGSGWSETFGILFGNFTEATEFFTNVSNVVGGFANAMGDARNKLLSDWKALGGRTVLIEAVSNAFTALINVLKPIKDAFRQIFPATTAKQLYDLTVTLRDFTAKLKIGGETADRIKRIFAGFFAILSLGWNVISGVAKILFKLLGGVSAGSGGFLEFAARIGDWVVKMRNAIEKGQDLEKFFGKLGKILSKPIELFKKLGNAIEGLFDGIDSKGVGDGLLNFFKDMGKSIESFASKVGKVFSKLGSMIKSGLSGITWDDVLNTVLSGLGISLTAGIGLIITKMLGGFKGDGLFGKLHEVFEGLTDTLNSMQNTLRSVSLIAIAAAIGVLTISVVALSKIDANALTNALLAMTIMFAQLGGALYAFEKYLSPSDIGKMIGIAAAMVVLGIAVRVLVSSVKELAGLDWQGLAKGLLGLTGILGALIGTMKLMPDDKKLISSSIGLVILAGAIKLLVMSVTDLSGLSWEEMGKGLTGVASLLLALGLFTKFADADKSGLKSGVGILLLATGILLLSKALTDIAKLSWEQVAKGLAGIAAGLFMIIGAIDMLPPTALTSSGAILIVSLGLVSMGEALQKMGKMSWLEIAKGLVALLAAMTIIALALYVIPPTAPLAAAGVLLVAMSLLKIGDFLQKMSELSWDEIGRALAVLAGSLTIIALALLIMPGAIPGALALVIVAGALTILTPVLLALSQLSWEEIAKGLTALAGVFLVLGIASLLLAPVVPVLIALGLAIMLLGSAMLAGGLGVLAFALGLTLLSELGVKATDNIINIVKSLLGLIPMVMEEIGKGVIAFALVIASAGPAITMAITTVLLSLINAINILAPKIIDTLFNLLSKLLDTMNKHVPKMVDAGLKLLTGILDGIAKNIGGVVTSATNVIVAFLNGISNNIGRVTDAGVKLIISFVNGLADAIRNNQEAMNAAGRNLAMAIIDGLTGGLGSGISKVTARAREVAKSALKAAMDFLGINSPSKEFIKIGMGVNEGFAKGLDKYSSMTANSAEGVAATALDTVRNSLAGLSKLAVDGIDVNPTITPVLDLSDIRKNAGQIGSIFADHPLIVKEAYDKAKAVSADYQDSQGTLAEVKSSPGDNISFTQINNSPKALSAADIYRNTKNQLSVAKGALSSANNG